MLFEAERLGNINREVNGLNVKVVELQKIYNEFSTGNQDISAIRNFIRYVYNNSNNNNSLKYLCLFEMHPMITRKNSKYHQHNTFLELSNSFSLSSSYVSDDFLV